MTQLSLDSFDLAILDLLQKDCTVPQRTIAQAVHLSAPAVQRRIQRLRKVGVIQAEVALLDASLLGRPLTLMVEIHVHDESHAMTRALRERFLAEPAVQQCYAITGDTDFLLIITARDISDYQRITDQLLGSDDNIRRFRTSVVLNCLKAGFNIPLTSA